MVEVAAGDRLRLLCVYGDDDDAGELAIRLGDGVLPGAVEVVRAQSAAEAGSLLAEAHFDLILLDLELPDVSGLEAFRLVSAAARFSPIVVLTDPDDDEVGLAAVRAGAQDAVARGQTEAVPRAVRFATERGRVLAGQAADLRRQQLLLEVSRCGLEEQDLSELFMLAADALAEGLAVSRAVVVELAAGGGVVLRGGAGLADDLVGTVIAELGDGSWAATAARQVSDGPVTVADAASTDGHWLVQPVVVDGGVWGLLGVWVARPRDDLEREVAFVGQLAALLSGVIALRAAHAAMGERVKELRALRTLARVMVDDVPRAALATLGCDTLRDAMQFPEFTVAMVDVDGARAVSPEGDHDRSVCGLHSDVVVDGTVRGRVEVGYTQRLPFLDEEQQLVDAAAETLSAWLSRHVAFEELRDREAAGRLQATALSAAANGVVITGPDGTIEWVNDAFTAMSGYSLDEAVGSDPRLWKSGRQDEALYRDPWETVLSGEVWRGRLVNRHADGHEYTVHQTITPVMDGAGTIEQLVAIQEDVTRIDEATRALETSRRRLQALFDTSLDAILLEDDEGGFLDVNPAAEEITGYPRGDLLSMSAADLVAEQPAGDTTAWFGQFVTAGNDIDTVSLRHKDGHIIDVEYRAVANIQPGVNLAVLRDVTDRNALVRGLAERERRFRQLAENATDIVAQLRFDPNTGMHVDYANPAAADIFGYSLERIYNEPDLLFHLFEDHEQLARALNTVPTSDNTSTAATVRVRRADGTLAWLEVNATLSDPSTTPVTVQIVGRDITARQQAIQALERAVQDQQRAADQLRELNAMKDMFLQSVSHELRTPLTAVLGFAELLANHDRRVSDHQIQGLHDRLLVNARRLERLLDDLLDVDRLTRGFVTVVRRPTDLSALIRQVVEDSDLDLHPISLELEPVRLPVDGSLIERIMHNLIRNIVVHTPPGTPITIHLRPIEDGAEVIVDDDGPGILTAHRQRLLEPFQQGSASAEAANPGTGMGLALVQAFAGLHDGDVQITDSPTGGARVTVTLAGTNPHTPQTRSPRPAANERHLLPPVARHHRSSSTPRVHG